MKEWISHLKSTLTERSFSVNRQVLYITKKYRKGNSCFQFSVFLQTVTDVVSWTKGIPSREIIKFGEIIIPVQTGVRPPFWQGSNLQGIRKVAQRNSKQIHGYDYVDINVQFNQYKSSHCDKIHRHYHIIANWNIQSTNTLGYTRINPVNLVLHINCTRPRKWLNRWPVGFL